MRPPIFKLKKPEEDKKVPVAVALNVSLLKAIDGIAAVAGISRSEAVRQILEQFVSKIDG